MIWLLLLLIFIAQNSAYQFESKLEILNTYYTHKQKQKEKIYTIKKS
jgi:hypothetical protein